MLHFVLAHSYENNYFESRTLLICEPIFSSAEPLQFWNTFLLINLCKSEFKLYQVNYVNTIPVDALATRIARASAGMKLTKTCTQITIFIHVNITHQCNVMGVFGLVLTFT